MNLSNSSLDWSEYGIDLILQLGLLIAVFALGIWLWPEGLLDTPVPRITLASWLWAGAAIGSGALGLLMSYFVLAEPVVALIRGLKAK
jgi:hypothetical protein